MKKFVAKSTAMVVIGVVSMAGFTACSAPEKDRAPVVKVDSSGISAAKKAIEKRKTDEARKEIVKKKAVEKLVKELEHDKGVKRNGLNQELMSDDVTVSKV